MKWIASFLFTLVAGKRTDDVSCETEHNPSVKQIEKKQSVHGTHIRYKAASVRLQTMQTLKGSKRKTSVESQTAVYQWKKKSGVERRSNRETSQHECAPVSTSWHAPLRAKTSNKLPRIFIMLSAQLHSTENVQTFVYYAFFIQSIYQKLSSPTKTNPAVGLFGAVNFKKIFSLCQQCFNFYAM